MLTGLTGEFDHGCTNQIYNNDNICTWTISPDRAGEILLLFDTSNFDISDDDFISVYDGSSEEGRYLAVFNNLYRPADTIIAGSMMHIKLISNETDPGKGFKARYWTRTRPVYSNEIKELSRMKIYPNPFSNSTIIEFPNPDFESYKLKLTDLTGKVYLIEDHITGSRYELQRKNLKSGIYFVQLKGPESYKGIIIIE